MKNTGYFLLLLVCFITGSCKKKLDNNVLISGTGNSNGGSFNGDLLIRTSIRYDSDSTVFTYTYNNTKQLVATQYRPSSAGTFFNDDIDRDAAGLIVRRKEYITTLSNPTPANISITTYHYSNSTPPQITYSIKTTEGIFTVIAFCTLTTLPESLLKPIYTNCITQPVLFLLNGRHLPTIQQEM